ncbi:MAG: hypothetical protein ACLQVD_02050 [Capsulimonadaceae bacterium]
MKIANLKSVAALSVAAAAFVFVAPAHAAWTLSGTPTGGYNAGSSGSGLNPSYTSSSVSFYDYGIDTAGPLTGSITYTGTITWTGGGTQPAYVTLTEDGDVYGELAYSSTGTTTANDGLGDPPVTTITSGYPGPSKTTSSSGDHSTEIFIAQGGSYKFTVTLSCSADTTSGGFNEGLLGFEASVQ